MRRRLRNLRCFIGWHDWPAKPTTSTWLHHVYVCRNEACLATKARDML